MLFAGISQGLGQGMKQQVQGGMDREKMQMLRNDADMKRKMFQQNQSKGNLEIEALTKRLEAAEMANYKQGMMMLRDGSYENIDNFLDSPKEDGTLDGRYLRSTYVDNPMMNKIMAKKMGLPNITSVDYDTTAGEIKFRGGEGKEVKRPIELFLGDIGYFTKRDEISNEKANKRLEKLKLKTSIKKDQASIEASKASAFKSSLDINKTMKSLDKNATIQELRDTAKELNISENAEPSSLYEYANAVKNNPELSESIQKDSAVQDTMRLVSIQRQVKNFQKKVKNSEGLASLVSMGKQALEKYAAGTGLTKEQRAAAREAIKLKTEGANIVANYIKILSGAAFGEVELAEKIKALGLDFGTGKEGALAAIEGLLTNMRDGNDAAINTLSHDKAAYVKGVTIPKEYKDVKFGVQTKVGDQEIIITGYNPSTGKLQFKKVSKGIGFYGSDDVVEVDVSKMVTNSTKPMLEDYKEQIKKSGVVKNALTDSYDATYEYNKSEGLSESQNLGKFREEAKDYKNAKYFSKFHKEQIQEYMKDKFGPNLIDGIIPEEYEKNILSYESDKIDHGDGKTIYGGLDFEAEDPKKLKQYHKELGIEEKDFDKYTDAEKKALGREMIKDRVIELEVKSPFSELINAKLANLAVRDDYLLRNIEDFDTVDELENYLMTGKIRSRRSGKGRVSRSHAVLDRIDKTLVDLEQSELTDTYKWLIGNSKDSLVVKNGKPTALYSAYKSNDKKAFLAEMDKLKISKENKAELLRKVL